jgi:hypothetical protein
VRCNWCEVERLKLVHKKKTVKVVKKRKNFYDVLVDGKCVMFFMRWKDECFCGE